MLKVRRKCYAAEVNYCRCWSRDAEVLLVLIPGSLHLHNFFARDVTWIQTPDCASAVFVYWSLVVTVCD